MDVLVENISPRDMLISLLSIPPAACDNFITGGLLDLHKMVNFFYSYEENDSYSVERTGAALIYLVSDMFLVTSSTRVDPIIWGLTH